MLPTLFRIGGVQVHSYSLMVLVAYLAGVLFVERRAGRFGFRPRQVTDFAPLALVALILASRLFYVALNWQHFRHNLGGVFAVWQGGLTFYGGGIVVVILALIYAHFKRMSKLRLLDAIVPMAFLAVGFVRIGCLLNGCCFGRPTDCPVGLVFDPSSPAGLVFPGQRLHPTQLYYSLAGFGLFFLTLRLERQRLKPGALLSLALVGYSVLRFLVNFLRYFQIRSEFWYNQSVLLGLAMAGVVLFFVLRNRRSAAARK